MDSFSYSLNTSLGIDELQLLKNHFKSQEAEWRSQKTKLEQKAELLELKLKETKEREENLRNLNNSIMNAFNDVSKETINAKPSRELEKLNEQYSRELTECKNQMQIQLFTHERERKELQEKINSMETIYQQSKNTYEEEIANLKKQISEIKGENKKFDNIMFNHMDEKRKIREEIESEYKIKIYEKTMEFEKCKEFHANEIRQLEKENKLTQDNIKFTYEQEKKVLKDKIEGLTNEVTVLTKGNDKNYLLYDELHKKMQDDIANLKRDKLDAQKKAESMERETMKLRHSVKEMEMNCEATIRDTREENLALKEENNALKRNFSEISNKNKNIEHSEKTLRTLLSEKENQIDEERQDLKKKLNKEKKKSEQLTEAINKIKEEFSKKQTLIIQELLNKDQTIKRLQQTVMKVNESAQIPGRKHFSMIQTDRMPIFTSSEEANQYFSQQNQQQLKVFTSLDDVYFLNGGANANISGLPSTVKNYQEALLEQNCSSIQEDFNMRDEPLVSPSSFIFSSPKGSNFNQKNQQSLARSTIDGFKEGTERQKKEASCFEAEIEREKEKVAPHSVFYDAGRKSHMKERSVDMYENNNLDTSSNQIRKLNADLTTDKKNSKTNNNSQVNKSNINTSKISLVKGEKKRNASQVNLSKLKKKEEKKEVQPLDLKKAKNTSVNLSMTPVNQRGISKKNGKQMSTYLDISRCCNEGQNNDDSFLNNIEDNSTGNKSDKNNKSINYPLTERSTTPIQDRTASRLLGKQTEIKENPRIQMETNQKGGEQQSIGKNPPHIERNFDDFSMLLQSSQNPFGELSRIDNSNGIAGKIRELEERLKKTEGENENLREEKNKIKYDLDYLVTEIKKSKTDCSGNEDKREDLDLAIKKELKSLLENLVKVNGQPSSKSNSNDSILNDSCLQPLLLNARPSHGESEKENKQPKHFTNNGKQKQDKPTAKVNYDDWSGRYAPAGFDSDYKKGAEFISKDLDDLDKDRCLSTTESPLHEKINEFNSTNRTAILKNLVNNSFYVKSMHEVNHHGK